MMKTCPECSETLSLKARRCACGWRAAGVADKLHTYRCEWVARERCHYAGSITAGTRGEGPWYCRDHFFCRDALSGDEITNISRKEFPHPDDAVNYGARRVLDARPSAPIASERVRAILRGFRESIYANKDSGMRVVGRDLERDVERVAIQVEGSA